MARYVGRHGSKRVAAAVLVAAVPPIMLKTAANPEGLPIRVFDDIRAGVAGDRSQFYKDLAIQFYGAIGQERRCHKASWISSGSGACRLALWAHTNPSKHFANRLH